MRASHAGTPHAETKEAIALCLGCAPMRYGTVEHFLLQIYFFHGFRQCLRMCMYITHKN